MVVSFFLSDIYSAYNELTYLKVSRGDVKSLKFVAKYSDGTYKRIFNPDIKFYSGEQYFSIDNNDNLTVLNNAQPGRYQVRASTVLEGREWGYTFTIDVVTQKATGYYLKKDGVQVSQIEVTPGEEYGLDMYAIIDGRERLWNENNFEYIRGDFVPTFSGDYITIPANSTGSAIVRASATIKGTEFGYTFTVIAGDVVPEYDNEVTGYVKIRSNLVLPAFKTFPDSVEEYIAVSNESPILLSELIGDEVLDYPPYGATPINGGLKIDAYAAQRIYRLCIPSFDSSINAGYAFSLTGKYNVSGGTAYGTFDSYRGEIDEIPKTPSGGYNSYISVKKPKLSDSAQIYAPPIDFGIGTSQSITVVEAIPRQYVFKTREEAEQATIRNFHVTYNGSRLTSISLNRGDSIVIGGSITDPKGTQRAYNIMTAETKVGQGDVTFENMGIRDDGSVSARASSGIRITVSDGATNNIVMVRAAVKFWDVEYGYTFTININNPVVPSSPLNPGGTNSPSNPVSPGIPDIPGGSGGTPSGPSPGEWEDAIGGTIAPDKSPINSTFAGLFRTYAMTLGQVQKLGQELWSPGILDTITKYFENPTDIIMGVYEFPFDIGTGAGEEITFNWIPSWLSTLDVRGTRVEYEYITVDMGEIKVPRYSGTFYDYQPYTTAELYLPYVGFVPIKYSEIVGEKIGIKYNISKTTGAACAMVSSTKSGRGLIGIYNCSVGRQLPISARDMSSLYANIFKSATSLIGGAIGAMAGAGAVAIGAAGSVGAGMAGGYSLQAAGLVKQGVNMVKHGAKQFGQSAINSVSNANTPVQRSGTLDAITGRLSNQKAFLAVSIPHQNLPAAYGQTIGYPCNVGGFLRQFNGYTEVRSINLSVSGATSEELVEIEEIVKGGIII